jgi:hypothetical protein
MLTSNSGSIAINVAACCVVDYVMDDQLRSGLVSAALANALAVRNLGMGIFYSGTGGPVDLRGVPCACRRILNSYVSPTAGSMLEDALSESFFASIKDELIDTQP